MADVTRERVGTLLRKLFEILMKHPEGLQAKDALAALAASVELSDYEAGEYASGGRRFEKIVRFATVDCVKAGWLAKTRGKWFVTEEGRKAHGKFKDPEEFHREAARLYRQWKSLQPDSPEESQPEGEVDDGKAANVTFEEAEEQAWLEISEYLRAMNPYEFQELVASLLRAMGYHVAWVAPPGKDAGIDVLAWSDPLGTKPPRIKVQVKRQQSSVSVDGLRSFMAVLGDDDVGIFVSTGGFTRDAQDEARTQEKRQVTLIDLERLFDLWVKYWDKLDEAARRRLPLQPIWFLAPEV